MSQINNEQNINELYQNRRTFLANTNNQDQEIIGTEIQNNEPELAIELPYNDIDESGDGPWYPKDVTFIFPYSGISFLSGYSRPFGRCKVRVRKNLSGYHVRVYEPQDTGTISVTNWIEHIATGLYRSFMKEEDPGRITWTIHYEKESGVSEAHDFPLRLYWDGAHFYWPKPEPECETRSGFWAWLLGRPKRARRLQAACDKPLIASPAEGARWRDIWQEPATSAKEGAQ